MATQGAEYYYLDISIIDEPRVISEIETDQETLRCVSCLNDEEIWTYSNNSMRLYNLKSRLLKTSNTKSGGVSMHLMVTKIGDLNYTDYDDRTVKKLRNSHTVIKLLDGYLAVSAVPPPATFWF